MRDPTHVVDVAGVKIGGGHPIVVQAMTNTPTADVVATAAQVVELAQAGAEFVRVSIDTSDAARAVPELRARVSDAGVDVPLIGDFHYNGHRLLRQFPRLIEVLAKIRINPGNVNSGKGGSGKGGSGKGSSDENFQTMIAIA
ncbi:MAG: flavodoxin-dependent (E)-4-hydroxy-3-methylbut-2-enyl-diphosphate synthase, partial [Deltaproteobacteria bacterium]|nr:flavodoxin-dependent (E)-4-hydroxy-3-methylbut-2-enyl-diphosphate synthase [Deltaproteobacteria bacterium]